MLKQKLTTLKTLPAVSLEVAAHTALLLPVVVILLKTMSYKRVIHWLEFKAPEKGSPLRSDEELQRTLSEIEQGFRLGYKYSPVKGACLARSIVLMAILARKKINSRVVIGVRKQGKVFGAHAWVELKECNFGPDSSNSLYYVTIA